MSSPVAEVFEPLLEPRRYKGLKGGRGGAKSHFVAEDLLVQATEKHIRCACLRETQTSIRDSVKQLLDDTIVKLEATDIFHSTDREIIGPNESLFVFKGLRNHTASSMKSMEGFNRGWYEEAQTLSQRSLDIATPTFRAKKSEQIFTWNPDLPTAPVDVMFHENQNDPDFIMIHSNWYDNPWFPDDLFRDMQRDKRRDYDKYLHIWEGQYLKNSEARVFKSWEGSTFETPIGAFFMHGADWGFSIDPTVLIRCFVGRFVSGRAIPDPGGNHLFIDHESYKVGVEIDDTPTFFDQLVKVGNRPDLQQIGAARNWHIIADSSNPQAISYLRRHGYPNIRASVKGAGSIKEGIKFLQGFDIVVHPRCKRTIEELQHYLYVIDPLTNKPTNVLPSKKNHVIDALRYAVEQARRRRGRAISGTMGS